MENSNYSFLICLKYRVFPCILDSRIPPSTSLISRSLVRRSSAPISSAISAAGNQGSTDLNFIANRNSLSVCGSLDFCFNIIKSLVTDTQFKYICLMLLVANDANFIYSWAYIT